MSMTSWIVLCVSIIFAAIFVSFIIFILIRRYVHHEILKKHHDLATVLMSVLGILYSVLIGFMIVKTESDFVTIMSKANKEAYLCADLFRVALALPHAFGTETQDLIGAYLYSVAKDEWPLMSKKMESPKTLKALENLWTPFLTYTPKNERETLWFQQSLGILFQFNDARLERIYSSSHELGKLTWVALILGASFIIIYLFFFGSENNYSQMIMSVILVGYLTFLIFVVFALDRPFSPPQMVKPRAYEIIYNYYMRVREKNISPEEKNLFKSFKEKAK